MAELSGVWRYDTSNVLDDPTPGYCRSSSEPVSWFALATLTWGGADVRADLLSLNEGAQIDVQEVSDATLAWRFDVTAAPIDHVTWVEYAVVPVTTTAVGPPRPNEDLLVLGRAAVDVSHPSYATVAELMRVLPLRTPTPAQGTALQRVLDTAAAEINSEIGTSWPDVSLASFPFTGTYDGSGNYIDVPDPLAAALIFEVNLERAVEHWQQQESPFGVVGLGDPVPTMTARDTWDRHAHKLMPLKRAWGIS